MADEKTSSTIDFSTLPQGELIASLGRINKDKFPANYEACLVEIKTRKEKGLWNEVQTTPPLGSQVPKLVVGFWIRVVADVIDLAILWTFAMVLSLGLENWFVKLGEHGVWLGLLVSIAYFVPSQSSFGNGQSLGKRILGIQVLNMNGEPLSLVKSFLRYLIIAFVGYIGVFSGVVNLIVGSELSTMADSIVGAMWFVAVVGCYLFLPLHPLKRGLHDLVANSIVVYCDRFNATALASLDNPAKTKKALAIVGAVSAVIILVGLWSFTAVKRNPAIATLLDIRNKLESTGKFNLTNVTDNTFSNNSNTTRSIIVQTFVGGSLNQTREDLKPLYDLAFQTIRDQVKDLSPYNNLRVGLRFGYNLGIRKRYTTLFQDESPGKPGERKDSGANNNF